MKKIFTLIFVSIFGFIATLQAQIDMGTGTGWGGLFPTEPLVLNDDFTGYTFFHSDSTTDMGNSNNSIDPVTQEILYGYKDTTFNVPFIGSTVNAKYECKQVAFAPDWKAAWAFRDEIENTPNVSDGFIEISRDYGSNPPTIAGSFIVDLQGLSYVDIIQWTHSSCGGKKRGVMLEWGTPDGDTIVWDTLRYQPGEPWSDSFTKDLYGEKTPNGYRCDPSAYGMVWEDGIWSDLPILLRFTACGYPQVPRIHDLKVYGTVGTTASKKIGQPELKVFAYDRIIRISKVANVAVYSITGKMVVTKKNTNKIPMSDFPDGLYIVKAQAGNTAKTSKVFLR